MRQFIAYFHFIDWSHISFGFHVWLKGPNIEVHVPFGFFRLGWQTGGVHDISPRTFGITEDRVAWDNKMDAAPMLVRLRWEE